MRHKDRGDAELVSVPAGSQCFGNAQSSVLLPFRSSPLFLPFLAALGSLLGSLLGRFRCRTCSAVTVGAESDAVSWEGEEAL